MALIRYKKGILLTLATIVLLVLMVAELITYVYLSISYQTVSSVGTVSNAGYNLVAGIKGGATSFIRSGLYSSLNALASYESRGLTKSLPINNTAYALQSLMSNGTIYGTNMLAFMGGTTLANYTNSIILQAEQQGFNLSINNATIQVYQTSPYSINATISALGILNSSAGVFTYPIVVSSGISLNGTPDLYSVQRGNDYRIKITDNYPAAFVVGGNAISGSNSFIYGTVLYYNNPSFTNSNMMLASTNGASSGFGGVITTTGGSYGVPYLIYGNSNIFGAINGTSLLLDGTGRSLLNISSIQSAIYSDYYYNSSFAPSYLDWAQNNVSGRSQYGLYSFNLYNRLVPLFSSSGVSSISMNRLSLGSAAHFSISLWFNPNSIQTANIVQQGSFGLEEIGQKVYLNSLCGSVNTITFSNLQNGWHNLVAVYNSSSSPNTYMYINGSQVGNGMSCGMGSGNFIAGNSNFGGSISNLQAYSTSLNNYQAAELYYEGIDGIALPGNLIGWWPLDGNSNDISGNGNNGNVISSRSGATDYQYLYGYTGNPIYDGSFYSSGTANIVEGAYNCANMGQCCNHSLQHLYLYNTSLSSVAGSSENEAAALGLANALIPVC